MRAKNTAILFFLLALLLTGILFFREQQITRTPSTVRINDVTLRVERADTDAERVRGLSGRLLLGTDEGMLFVWDTPDRYGIWMKDMRFPLDIIWIGADKHVVDIFKHATPASYPKIFQPINPAQYVLEVNAGFADQHSISTNTPISF